MELRITLTQHVTYQTLTDEWNFMKDQESEDTHRAEECAALLKGQVPAQD